MFVTVVCFVSYLLVVFVFPLYVTCQLLRVFSLNVRHVHARIHSSLSTGQRIISSKRRPLIYLENKLSL